MSGAFEVFLVLSLLALGLSPSTGGTDVHVTSCLIVHGGFYDSGQLAPLRSHITTLYMYTGLP